MSEKREREARRVARKVSRAVSLAVRAGEAAKQAHEAMLHFSRVRAPATKEARDGS